EVTRLFVHVDIAHPARGDLHVTLVAPDGTEVLLHDSSLDRTADIHGTFGLDLQPVQSLDVFNGRPATGTWRLRVADILPLDSGTLLSWSLVLQFFGDEPSNVRPASQPGSKFVAAVAHAPGANGTLWRSDVRLMNRGVSSANVTLVFTPSGEDGNARFGAVKLAVEPGQVVALDDIVAEQFQTVGTGQLEIIGDVLANARTYTNATHGTYGQFTPAVDADSVAAGESPLVVTLLRNDAAFRSNVGFAEIAGQAGAIRERLYDALSGGQVAENVFAIGAFSHRQELVTAAFGPLIARIDVIDGGARVIAYGAVVDNRTGDPIYVPAARPAAVATSQFAPVISSAGAFDTHWTSDVWLTAPGMQATFVDARTGERLDQTFGSVFATGFFEDIVAAFERPGALGLLRADVPAGALAFARTGTPGDGGTFGQFVPFRPIDTSANTVMPVESSLFFRTNIGVANLGDAPATLRIVVHDSGGATLGSLDVAAGPSRLIQVPISAVIGSLPLRSGSASVERLDGSQPFLLYASVVDNASGDAVHIPAQ
ncbi:MAG: proprotein convertase P-domain-containing protein, partial [Thermoanaerobaculia bacterium]